MTIALLWASSGSYDSYRQWLVAAYETPEPAEQHRDLARAWAESAYERVHAWQDAASDGDVMPEEASPYDPEFKSVEWLGSDEVPDYDVTTIETRTAVPAVIAPRGTEK